MLSEKKLRHPQKPPLRLKTRLSRPKKDPWSRTRPYSSRQNYTEFMSLTIRGLWDTFQEGYDEEGAAEGT